jgi:4-hydroxy-tetrahydrodipicolinate synthase
MNTDYRARLSGVFTALVTPFRNGIVDWEAYERHLEAQIGAGIHGLVPVGTTGEAATLTDEETDEIIRRAVKAANGRFVLAGAGSNSTAIAVEKAKRAESLGVDGILVVTPYYNKPSQAGLIRHFSEIAQVVSTPIVLYSVPGRTGVELAPETCAELARRYKHIVAIKEAGGRAERVTEIAKACGPDFIIHSGDDALTLPFLSLGAAGVTSVASNYLPGEMVRMYDLWTAGDVAGARAIHNRIYGLVKALFIESNPVPVKAAMAISGLIDKEVRNPLTEMSEANLSALIGEINALKRLSAGA